MIKISKKFFLVFFLLSIIFSGCEIATESNKKVDLKKVDEYDIVIVGAGIAGLTSGYFLKDKNLLILEKKDSVGGRTISGVHESFSYAKGTEYIGKPEEALMKMIDSLKLEPKEIPSPMDAYYDGKSFYYGSDGIKRYLVTHSSQENYNKFVRLMLNEYDEYDEIPNLNYNSEAKYLDNITAKNWLKNNSIPEVYLKKYNVTTKGLFGATLNDISALSFIPEAAFDYDSSSIYESSSEEFSIEEEYNEAKNNSSNSYSFENGLTELTNKLNEVLKDKIRLNSYVFKISKKNNKYEIQYTDNDKIIKTIIAKKIILAVPAPEALYIASDVLSQDKKDIMKDIKYSSYVTVALFSKTPIFDKAFDLAVPDEYYFTDIYDATWIERFYEKDKKNKKTYIASVYVAPKNGDDHTLDTIGDKELLDNIYKDLDKIFEGASSKVTGYDIERFPHAYPIMSVGAYERLLKLNKLNNGDLILAGDYMIYPTFEAAAQSGFLAAKKIKEEL